MTKSIDHLDLKTKIMGIGIEFPLEKRLENIIVAMESDSASFEKLDYEIDLENEILTLLYELESKNQWNEIEKFGRALQCQPKLFKEYNKYVSQTLIPLYLAKDREDSREQKGRIEDCLKPFYEDPQNSGDILFDVLDKLICYDQSSIAVDLCKKIYAEIATSDIFIINPKNAIAEIIVWDELQKVYTSLKRNMDADWLSFNKRCKIYEFQFNQDDLKSLEQVMKVSLDLTQMFNIFKKKRPLVLVQIKLAFCCQMYDLDGTSFVTSHNFASKIIDFLSTLPGRKNCPLQTFFKIKPDFLVPYLQKLIEGEWFDSTHKQFAFLAALPIFYLVLLKIGIIKMKTIEEILPTVYILKSEYGKNYSDRPWVFNFIKKLEKQSSMLTQLYQN
ncbi:MAG: hypothetical protein H0W88_02485 [Parachlamydiaceae bacterium]|nr:hypothetical protein [Parachlamydiaceae bacterium]